MAESVRRRALARSARRRATLGLACLGAAAALRAVAAAWPGGVEELYARGLYPVVARGLAAVASSSPVSIAETALAALAVLVPWRALAAWRRARREGDPRLAVLARGGAGALAFVASWGLCYQRPPFAERVGWTAGGAETSELAALCRRLAATVEALRAEVPEGADGTARLLGTPEGTMRRVKLGFERATADFPSLEGPFVEPRLAWSSPILARLWLAGIYSPFTGEPHVNALLPPVSLPFAACHETAHQRGVAREGEASFVAWLACERHPDVDFRYSGALAAMRYVLAALAAVEPEEHAAVVAGLGPAVERDLEAVRRFWERYRSPAARFSTSVNDLYLRSQGESEGVASYGRVVDLLLAERRARDGSG